MRMWGVAPQFMCNRHLLGEHLEMHMFAGSIDKGKSIQGYIDNGLVDTCRIQSRHDELAHEMRKRGMNHKSPLKYEDCLDLRSVDDRASRKELFRRCADCETRYKIAISHFEKEKVSVEWLITDNTDLLNYAYVVKHKWCSHLTEEQCASYMKISKQRIEERFPQHFTTT